MLLAPESLLTEIGVRPSLTEPTSAAVPPARVIGSSTSMVFSALRRAIGVAMPYAPADDNPRLCLIIHHRIDLDVDSVTAKMSCDQHFQPGPNFDVSSDESFRISPSSFRGYATSQHELVVPKAFNMNIVNGYEILSFRDIPCETSISTSFLFIGDLLRGSRISRHFSAPGVPRLVGSRDVLIRLDTTSGGLAEHGHQALYQLFSSANDR